MLGEQSLLTWWQLLLQSDTQCFTDRAETNSSDATRRSRVPHWAVAPAGAKQPRTPGGGTRGGRWSRSELPVSPGSMGWPCPRRRAWSPEHSRGRAWGHRTPGLSFRFDATTRTQNPESWPCHHSKPPCMPFRIFRSSSEVQGLPGGRLCPGPAEKSPCR